MEGYVRFSAADTKAGWTSFFRLLQQHLKQPLNLRLENTNTRRYIQCVISILLLIYFVLVGTSASFQLSVD